MATGRKAFAGDSKASLIAKILTFQPPPIGTIQPVSPPELDTVVQRCLAKKPEERWQSATNLTSELREIAAALPKLREQSGESQTRKNVKQSELPVERTVPAAASEPATAWSWLVRSRAWQLSFVGVLLSFGDWSLNGKAIYLCGPPFEPDLTALYVGLDGRSQVLWKRGISPGYSFDHPIPSPDGKHLVYTVVTYQMNAWMLENF